MYSNPRYVNEQGGILVDSTASGVPLYVDQDWLALYGQLVNGEFGEVTPFIAPAEDLEQLIGEKREEIEAAFKSEIAHINESYSEDEQKSFDRQVKQAELWKADNSAETPLLDSMLTTRTHSGISKAELVERILQKTAIYDSLYGAALGRKQDREDLLEAVDLNQGDAAFLIRQI